MIDFYGPEVAEIPWSLIELIELALKKDRSRAEYLIAKLSQEINHTDRDDFNSAVRKVIYTLRESPSQACLGMG